MYLTDLHKISLKNVNFTSYLAVKNLTVLPLCADKAFEKLTALLAL